MRTKSGVYDKDRVAVAGKCVPGKYQDRYILYILTTVLHFFLEDNTALPKHTRYATYNILTECTLPFVILLYGYKIVSSSWVFEMSPDLGKCFVFFHSFLFLIPIRATSNVCQ